MSRNSHPEPGGILQMNPQSCFSTEKFQLRVGKGHRGHKPAGNPSMEKESQWKMGFLPELGSLCSSPHPGDPELQPEVQPHPRNFTIGPKIFLFLEENASNSPQILPSPAPAPVGAVPAGLAASRGCGRPKNSKSKVKNSQFSWWERLQWQLCIARLGARG